MKKCFVLKSLYKIIKYNISMMSTSYSIFELNAVREVALMNLNYFHMNLNYTTYKWFNDLINRTYDYNYCRFDNTYKEFFY